MASAQALRALWASYAAVDAAGAPLCMDADAFADLCEACPGLLHDDFTLDDALDAYDAALAPDGDAAGGAQAPPPGLSFSQFVAALEGVAEDRYPGVGASPRVRRRRRPRARPVWTHTPSPCCAQREQRAPMLGCTHPPPSPCPPFRPSSPATATRRLWHRVRAAARDAHLPHSPQARAAGVSGSASCGGCAISGGGGGGGGDGRRRCGGLCRRRTAVAAGDDDGRHHDGARRRCSVCCCTARVNPPRGRRARRRAVAAASGSSAGQQRRRRRRRRRRRTRRLLVGATHRAAARRPGFGGAAAAPAPGGLQQQQ